MDWASFILFGFLSVYERVLTGLRRQQISLWAHWLAWLSSRLGLYAFDSIVSLEHNQASLGEWLYHGSSSCVMRIGGGIHMNGSSRLRRYSDMHMNGSSNWAIRSNGSSSCAIHMNYSITKVCIWMAHQTANLHLTPESLHTWEIANAQFQS